MSTSLIVEHSHIQVQLRHFDRMRGGTVEVEALVVLLRVALVGVHDVRHPVLRL